MQYAQVLNENFTIKEVDTKHVFNIGLTYDDGVPNLVGAIATLYVADKESAIIEKPMTINDDNTVSFAFDEGDITKAGVYDVEIVITYPNGKRETFPDTTYLKLKVLQNLKNRK